MSVALFVEVLILMHLGALDFNIIIIIYYLFTYIYLYLVCKSMIWLLSTI